jgi:lipopolysaccharide transport system ATP-binding protein
MNPILEITNIGKKYRIQHLAGGYMSLRERMVSALKFERSTTEDFWALKDISFDVLSGESVGIIGRNGAGKSTLLKILSKITPPTTGHILSRGRVASLLEVGTGFHPELTGRENIFFNGSLLGMKRKEIEVKFDEIVDFSGVEKFLDTQLKHFSSGMQLRLAFAVAAFLEPEILIIDEVLAVGDAEFQKKCLGKMKDVRAHGRTILFVSHSFETVQSLCQRGILLDKGTITFQGDMMDCINAYKTSIRKLNETELGNRLDRVGTHALVIRKISMHNQRGEDIKIVSSGDALNFSFELENKSGNSGEFQFDIGLLTDQEQEITWFSTSVTKNGIRRFETDSKTLTLKIDRLPLMPGDYQLIVYCKFADEVSDWVHNAFQFQVMAGDFYGTGKLNHASFGKFLVEHTFELN